MRKLNLGVLIYTYNRVDDAKINMEIIRDIWAKSKLFSDIKIVHTYNGNKSWYPEKYLEDDLVVIKNSGHFQGAAELIDAGMYRFKSKYKNIDYVIVMASDTWNIKPKYIYNIIKQIKEKSLYLATCAWGVHGRNDIKEVGMAVDFFILDLKWANKNKMFPINYKAFYNKFSDLFLYQKGGNVYLEKLLFSKYFKAIYHEFQNNVQFRDYALQKLFLLKDREPVHSHIDSHDFWIRKKYWPKMGLITHHEPQPKKEILKKYKITKGKNIQKLLNNDNLDYFNNIRIYNSNQ
ncbi:hypothetical protein KJ586_00930 [Patescibacteria group bacterium]|nr:hypothetical protein [Patescibacteria group bacterium]MBU4347552.1 hypothetical protein [Patescibacteria group bacterium]MBU4455058.1 hypothetical protein [Patescibacteria group bacterium]